MDPTGPPWEGGHWAFLLECVVRSEVHDGLVWSSMEGQQVWLSSRDSAWDPPVKCSLVSTRLVCAGLWVLVLVL